MINTSLIFLIMLVASCILFVYIFIIVFFDKRDFFWYLTTILYVQSPPPPPPHTHTHTPYPLVK